MDESLPRVLLLFLLAWFQETKVLKLLNDFSYILDRRLEIDLIHFYEIICDFIRCRFTVTMLPYEARC